jgi:Fe-S-cluster containining protein
MNCDLTCEDRDLWEAWHQAAVRPAVTTAFSNLYQQIDNQVAQRNPLCNASGRCCRFDEFGHRLYMTGLEICIFLAAVNKGSGAQRSGVRPAPQPLPILTHSPDRKAGVTESRGCPYQIEQLCSVHTLRPMGCRLFFCDPSSQQWQQDLYEHYHEQIKALHQQWELTYRYMEWRVGLAQADALT